MAPFEDLLTSVAVLGLAAEGFAVIGFNALCATIACLSHKGFVYALTSNYFAIIELCFTTLARYSFLFTLIDTVIIIITILNKNLSISNAL